MADTGFLNPAATGETYNEWSNPTNAYASDGSYASSESGNTRDEQDYYNFSPTIPAGSSILGIIVSIEGLPYAVKQPNFRVKLSWNAGSSWTATKDTGAYSSEVYKEVGGSAELWDRVWSIAELGNANFRIHIENIGDSAVAAYPCCDHVRVKIYYSEAATEVLQGAIAAQSSVAGVAKATREVAGTIAAQSSTTGALSVETPAQIVLQGVIAAQSSFTGGLATPVTVTTENDFIKIKYISSGAWATIELDADEVESIEIMPQVIDDMQRKQNNLPIIYKKPDAKLIVLNLYSNAIVDVEALKAVSDIMYLKIYRKATLLSSYAVKLDRQSCKTFGYFGGVPKDKNLQIAFYETESGYACLENQFNGVVY